MRRVYTGALSLVLVASALAALPRFPGLAAAVGLDGWDVPTLLDVISREARLAEQLDEHERATWRRMALKDEVAADAIAGRLTLFEAAARFRDLDADAPEAYRGAWRRSMAGDSDPERYCRQVIGYAAAVLQDPTGEAAVLQDLTAQLDQALARGDLRLPDPARD
jgi:hypothetical protein